MKPVVYIDVLFIINFILNLIVLWTGAKLLKIKPHKFRLIISSTLGAIYAIFVFFPKLSIFYSLVFKLAFSIILVLIAYNPRTKKEFIRNILIFYGANFTFGGIIFGICFFTNIGYSLGAMVSNGVFYFHISIATLFVSSVISYLIINMLMRYIKSRQTKQFENIEIGYNDMSITLQAMMDTGNTLVEPITHLPVIVVELKKLKPILSDELYTLFSSCIGDINLENIQLNNCQLDIKLIPYHALGKKNGLILGFKPTYVKTKNAYITDIVIGIYNNNLSTDNEYSALLNPAIF